MIATVPLIVALLTIRFAPAERAGGMRLVGLFVGFGGVVALLGLDVGATLLELLGAACILLAAFCYAVGPLIADRRLSKLDPLGSVAVALLIATVLLALAALLSAPQSVPSTKAVASVVALGFVCTALGMILFFFLIAQAGPSRATVITYINPAVAVVLGVAFLGESVGVVAVAGLILILPARGSRPAAERRRELAAVWLSPYGVLLRDARPPRRRGRAPR